MSSRMPDAAFRRTPQEGGRIAPAQMRRTRHESATALAAVPLFQGSTKRHLQRLARETDQLVFDPGQTVVEQGRLGETLYVVMSGRAKVTRGRRRVGEVVPGDFFGELSAIDGGPRTASVIAETPLIVLRLFRGTLRRLLEEEPGAALPLLDGMSRRLRQIQRRTG